ncbi:MAG: P-II family nitrogen regulator [Candidatus Omnitrophica bacterium]|nr:P-II family nitrogen regulator [Candidatus Omnitrophota bacterium]
MKKIECIIRQEKLKELSGALRLAGIAGATVSEVKGFGKEVSRPDNFLFLPKTKIELYITDDLVEDVVATIISCCKDESLGSGKIAILPLDDCIRVRTGERGDKAIV